MVSIDFPKNGVLWKKDEKSMPGEAQGLNIFSKSPSNPLGSLGMMDDGLLDVARGLNERSTPYKREPEHVYARRVPDRKSVV